MSSLQYPFHTPGLKTTLWACGTVLSLLESSAITWGVTAVQRLNTGCKNTKDLGKRLCRFSKRKEKPEIAINNPIRRKRVPIGTSFDIHYRKKKKSKNECLQE